MTENQTPKKGKPAQDVPAEHRVEALVAASEAFAVWLYNEVKKAKAQGNHEMALKLREAMIVMTKAHILASEQIGLVATPETDAEARAAFQRLSGDKLPTV